VALRHHEIGGERSLRSNVDLRIDLAHGVLLARRFSGLRR
jgi:hypothetical protein